MCCFLRWLPHCQRLLILILILAQVLKGNVICLWRENISTYMPTENCINRVYSNVCLVFIKIKLWWTGHIFMAFTHMRNQMCDDHCCIFLSMKRMRWESGKHTLSCKGMNTLKVLLIVRGSAHFWPSVGAKNSRPRSLTLMDSSIRLVKQEQSKWRNFSNRGLLILLCMCVWAATDCQNDEWVFASTPVCMLSVHMHCDYSYFPC